MTTDARILKLARERGEGILSRQAAWRASLERLSSAGIEIPLLQRLAAETRNPDTLDALAALLASGGERKLHAADGIRQLFIAVDASAFSLCNWLEALATLQHQLRQVGKKTDLPKAIGYVHCCAEAANARPEQGPLADIVAEMITQHGFDG